MMKDSKTFWLILLSFFLFIVSFALLWTWGYRIYIQTPSSTVKTQPIVIRKDSVAINNFTRDSLQKIYTENINKLNARFDSALVPVDSLTSQLGMQLDEFYQLRDEIAILLKNHGNVADLDLAKKKITSLQLRVNDLLDKNQDVESQNKKMSAVLEKISSNAKNPVTTVQQVSYDRTNTEKNEAPVVFIATDIRLAAITTTANKEQETTSALETEKLIGSFNLKNNARQNNNSEVMIVLLQPDGQVLKTSAWESGSFNTSEGKKIYSYKLNFDYNPGESQHLNFSLTSDKFQKGKYILQIYHKGTMIGKIQKTLS